MQVKVLGVKVPELQLSEAADGWYPGAHCVTHEDPESMLALLQAPPLDSRVTLGGVHGFARQVKVLGVRMLDSQRKEMVDGL